MLNGTHLREMRDALDFAIAKQGKDLESGILFFLQLASLMLSFRADGVEIQANCACLAITFADFNSYSEVLGSATPKNADNLRRKHVCL